MTITTKDSRSLFTFEVEEILQMHRKTKVHFPFNNEKPKKKKKERKRKQRGPTNIIKTQQGQPDPRQHYNDNISFLSSLCSHFFNHNHNIY